MKKSPCIQILLTRSKKEHQSGNEVQMNEWVNKKRVMPHNLQTRLDTQPISNHAQIKTALRFDVLGTLVGGKTTKNP